MARRMTPSAGLFTAMLDLLAADTATLSQAVNANSVSLVISDFTPSPTLTIGSLTLATFTGSTPLLIELNDQQVGFDPDLMMWFIELVPPVGGWYWECTVAPAAPETVFGGIVRNAAGAVLYASFLKDTPTIIQDVGDSVAFDQLRLYLSPDAFTA